MFKLKSFDILFFSKREMKINSMRESSKCENYLNATTSRSRNLIRVRSIRCPPILVDLFRTPNLVPAYFRSL